jgi:[acyl-carrier-protein] S-malonyltransferase
MIKLACVFPGQGSQSLGMLSDLAKQFSLITETFTSVSEGIGYDVWQLIQQGPESKLNQTEYTQVAMLTADVAVFRLLQQHGMGQIAMMAGHSLGEYAALVCADAVDLVDAAKLVSKRGQLMQETVPAGMGAMAAIVGLTDEQVETLCAEASNSDYQVNPANFNAIGQVVVAGHTQAVEKVMSLAETSGARLATLIPVSVPCHCSLLVDAATSFEAYLEATTFRVPNTSVVSNVDLSIYQSAQQIRSLLKEQLYKPVRWVETIQFLQSQGVTSLIECGPAKVLSGLVKRIDKSLQTLNVHDGVSLDHALTYLRGSK